MWIKQLKVKDFRAFQKETTINLSSNVTAIAGLAESKGDSSCSYIKFAETWCIPSDLYENVKEEFKDVY
ncbi:hypothetical protein [Ligilactobacillus ruminis]|jgi:hypothetical protein|uniref:hypothetical protein n=1 Tax=Ligilactobacillus ruminis TaxID=1623 RepID=UPI003B9A117B